MGETARSTDPDVGLFGPGSVTWKVHGDVSMALAGMRALLLQAVHPLAMAGVAQFSDYRSDPWGRLQRTANFVGVTTYGTTEQAQAAGARVRAVHARLGGVDPETGRAYRVADPALLRWVHVCETQSFLETYRRAGGRLGPGEADRYYAEMEQVAQLVGARHVPTDEAGVQAYFAAMRPELHVSRAARRAARFLLVPPMPRWVSYATPARAGWIALGAEGFALLPGWARRLYGLPGLPTTDPVAALTARGLRAGLGLLPQQLREGPHRRDALARLAGPAV